MKFSILFIFFLTTGVFAQPSVSNVATSDIDYTSLRITFQTSPASYTRILYGNASGNLVYATNSDGSDEIGAATHHGFQLTALPSGATWWYSIEARPTAAHDCIATPASCTTTAPASFTTSVETSTSRLPTLPTVWRPTYPDTTGYYTIPVARSGVHGDCVATANVSGTDTVTAWDVTIGMSLQEIILEVGYGVIIEVPQGTICDNRTYEDTQYPVALTYKSVDPRASGLSDPTHKWIIIRTAPGTADFPPYGGQTGPAYYSKMAKLRATKHKYETAGFYSGQDPSERSHHYWIENFAIAPDPAGILLGTTGPRWNNLICLGCTGGGSYVDYMVMDRMYFKADSPYGSGSVDHCTLRAIYVGGTYIAAIGNYVEADCPENAIGSGSGNMAVGMEVRINSAGPLTVENNFFKVVGMTFYIETQAATVIPNNISYLRNMHWTPESAMKPPADRLGVSTWDNIPRHYRQQWESKGSRNVLIDGNIFDGGFAAQNEGPAILVTANTNGTAGALGNKDYTITNNIIRRSANILNCASVRVGGPPPGGPDLAPMTRLMFVNNIVFDLGRGKWSKDGAGSGIWNGQIGLGCTDMVIRRNTLGWATNVDINTARMASATFFTGLGMTPLSGLRVEDNIFHVNSGDQAQTIGVYRHAMGVVGTHPPIPQLVDNSTPKAAIDSMYGYLNGSGGVTASYFWRGNIIVAGTGAAFGNYTLDDLDQTEVNTLKSTYTMPGDGNDVWMAGANRSTRATAAGITDNLSLLSYRVIPTTSHSGHAGANIDQIYSAHGIVSKIRVSATESGARISYIAPDSNTCSIDMSTDGSTWISRTTDAGGSRIRNTVITGLSASTLYYWRLNCYRVQAVQDPYDFLASHEVTSGTFTTTSAGTRVISVGFSLPSGATKVVVTAIPAGGATVTATCTTSPCELTLGKRGAYTLRKSYQNNSDVVLALSEIQNMETP